jgi:membrane protease YdiL (CAAX protease family)
MRNPWLRSLIGFTWGLLLFLGVAWSLRLGLGSELSRSAVVSQVVLKAVLVLVALLAWRLLGRPFPEMGWQRADWWNQSYLRWFGIAALSMMAASVVMICLGLRHPVVAQMRFWQIVLVVWVLSSFSEEVFVRGLVQSWIADRDDAYGIASSFEPAIVSSALLFAAMHVPLMLSPIGLTGGLPIVLATLGVGFGCAVLRARTKSLWPAIACHVIGNVAAIPGGILGVIVYRLIYGHLPDFVTPG